MSLEMVPRPASLQGKIDAFWLDCHSVPRGVTQHHLCPPCIPLVTLLHKSQPQLLVVCKEESEGAEGDGEI